MDAPKPRQPLSGQEPPDPGHLLFAYGTLMLSTGFSDVDAAMRDTGPSLGRGWIHGRLFDLGAYPGAVAAKPEEASKVWGRLIPLRDPEAFFAVIDRYEGFEPGNPAGSEFVRAETRVFLPETGRVYSSQVYWYTPPCAGLEPIESGDYLAYGIAKGKPGPSYWPSPGE